MFFDGFILGAIFGTLGTLAASALVVWVAVRECSGFNEDAPPESEIFRSVEHPRRVSVTAHALPH
jgi:hypothetical protein